MAANFVTSGGGTTFTDYHEGYSETLGQGQFQIIRPCRVGWRDRFVFAKEMVGWSYLGDAVLPNNANSKIYRYLPDRHPEGGSGVGINVYAVRCVNREPRGAPGETGPANMIDYGANGYAIMDVTYEPLRYRIESDDNNTDEFNRFVTKKIQHTVDVLQIPGQSFKVGTTTVTEPQPYKIPGAEINYIWHDIPVDPVTLALPSTLVTNITSGIGKVNSAAFDGYAAESLVAMPPQFIPGFNAGGFPNFNIVYRMLWRGGTKGASTATWNKLLNPHVNPPVWEDLTFTNGGGDAYETYSFSKFFQTA